MIGIFLHHIINTEVPFHTLTTTSLKKNPEMAIVNLNGEITYQARKALFIPNDLSLKSTP
jgi:hypothetical protein